MSRTHLTRSLKLAGLAVLCAAMQVAAGETKRLTLSEAVHLALDQNRALKIARFRVREH